MRQISNFFIHFRANFGVVLAGWGANETLGDTASKLQHTRVIVEPQNLCNDSYSNLSDRNPNSIQIQLVLPELFQSNVVCAGSEVCNI